MKTAGLNNKTTKHLSPLAAWAFALGTSIGWGSLVITTSDYLKRSGPIGSTIGLLISGLIMLLIGRNYAYMINRCPDQGGAYTYTKTVLGYDYGFLSAWFMILTYLSMLWANATSLPLFARYFFGNIFQYGYLYTIFGYAYNGSDLYRPKQVYRPTDECSVSYFLFWHYHLFYLCLYAS